MLKWTEQLQLVIGHYAWLHQQNLSPVIKETIAAKKEENEGHIYKVHMQRQKV